MRKQLLSVILPLLVMGLVASAAEIPASQPASQRNELQGVNVVRGTDEIRIEISAQGAVSPKLSTADLPARLVLELPGTVMATGQSHITVGTAGVKGVRIGMDGQKPPTTKVVVDLDRALRYELNPSADGKLVLTLYTQQSASAKAPKNLTATVAGKNPTPVAAAVTKSVAPKADAAKAMTVSSDFVFVEPTYQARKSVPETVSEPA